MAKNRESVPGKTRLGESKLYFSKKFPFGEQKRAAQAS
jgi:hypothetical protein